MRLALIIVSVLAVLAFALYYLTVDRSVSQESISLPWQVKVIDDRHSEILGIVLNQTSLEQARERFGQLEGIGLYQDSAGQFSLEAYFGKVSTGPFSARLIATLDAPQVELEALLEHTVKRSKTEDGSLKWTLKQEQQLEQATRKVRSLAYIPAYRGMDQQFIQQRFGDPQRREAVDEGVELWFYPAIGARVLVDQAGNEMFEYLALSDFNAIYGAH
jgi:hypothetical protein